MSKLFKGRSKEFERDSLDTLQRIGLRKEEIKNLRLSEIPEYADDFHDYYTFLHNTSPFPVYVQGNLPEESETKSFLKIEPGIIREWPIYKMGDEITIYIHPQLKEIAYSRTVSKSKLYIVGFQPFIEK